MLRNIPVNKAVMVKVGLAFCFTVIVVVVVLVITLCLRETSASDPVDFYENLIVTESGKAMEYVAPEDAGRYRPESDTILDFGSFDFIIVGAGSAGAVLANRLSEVPYWRVLLLEAGTFPNNLTEIPALYSLGCFSDYNWSFKSVPQTTACLGTDQQQCVAPRGRGLGGTTLINGLLYTRGHHSDYDKWATLLNDSSWSYERVLPYFKKSENFKATDPEAPVDYAYHATGGYWNVEHHNPSITLKQVFLDANAELGYNLTDYNGRSKMGGTIVQYNTLEGRRHDQGTAFILPVIDRENLQVQTESYVTKVEINNATKEATGVLFTYQGQTYRATVEKEVVLSAGVVSTPQILMLSGVGPQQHLEDLGIPVVQNLSVGSSLRDHTGVFGLQFSSNMTESSSTLREQIEEYLNGTGPLTSNSKSHVIGWYKSSYEEIPDYADLELVLDVSGENSPLGQRFLNWNNETWNSLWGNHSSSFYINVILLHVQSLGTIRLKSQDPFDYPLIDYNLLSDELGKDLDTLYEGINLVLDVINTTAFKRIDAKLEERPVPACGDLEYLSREYWYCYMRQMSVPVFHSVGTCPAGSDPSQGAVVDSQLRVFGIRNLRVVDAGVFPFTLSSHPSADCAMVAEKISDDIKFEYP